MGNERMLDLDELVLRCRDEQARRYIAEAAACYRAGAFRACVVATWVAVVFDYVHKLRELELAGDKAAEKEVHEFEDIRAKGDVTRSLKFERDVLDKAKNNFELISPMEYEDLYRLHNDRNRCAHPSMNSVEEIYQPSAELARYHLRSAVTHLLQHPPVQGKAALDRLRRDIGSEYFPVEEERALEFFRQGPLARPRDSLVREFLRDLFKGLFHTTLTARSESQYLAAFRAVRQMHRVVAEQFLNDKLGGIIRGLTDEELTRALRFMHAVTDSWEYLQDDVRLKLENFVAGLPEEPTSTMLHLHLALDLPSLKTMAAQRLKSLTPISLKTLLDTRPRPELLANIIELYAQSSNFQEANSRGYLLWQNLSLLKEAEVNRIIEIAAENAQVRSSTGFDRLLSRLPGGGIVTRAFLEALLVKYGIKTEPDILDSRVEIEGVSADD